MKNGKLCKKEHEICFIRGDQITFVSPKIKSQLNTESLT